MNITWCNTRPSAIMRSDVSINLTNKKTALRIRISAGAMSTKLHNADHILVGFDESNSVMAFCSGGTKGFKVKRNGDNSATITISVLHVEGHVKPSELSGDYYMKKGDNDIAYISIGALSHRG